MKKCIYCGKEVQEDSVMDFCDNCGIKVWGPKMLKAIKGNYEKARDNGDLHGMNSINPPSKNIK
ncbi:MAG: hypothetical protein NTU63_01305 [Candidatus Pacearchaeota archaeon]|nr:hypothetical protein [Candidatus Pacearchaeota archaeon]